jgi:hypothetical protein
MKKQLLLLSFVMTSFLVNAQVLVPNSGFENWNSATYDYPQYYPQSSNPQTFFQCHTAFNVTQSADAYHGTHAVQLTTNGSGNNICGGFFLNATNTNGNPNTWQGGIPYNQQATGIRGYYKYNQASADSALIIAIFKLGGTTIGVYFFNMGGVHTSYTPFNFTFAPALPAAPDTVIFAAASSDLITFNGVPGSTLLLDSVSFTGVANQPAMMNGDFESWQTQTLYDPVGWFDQYGQGDGFSRTNDAYAGSYAMELQTRAGNNNGNPLAQPGSISTGFWDQMCGCQVGGSPFSNQVDTFSFYYKYVPADPADSAQVSLYFKSNGTPVWYSNLNLPASASYQYIELPFNMFSVPDSVIISFQSSLWTDSLLSFVGADLKIDEMHFKTFTPVGVHEIRNNENVTVYPNPLNTFSIISVNPKIKINGMEMRLYDAFGRMIQTTVMETHRTTLEKKDLPAGVYFYDVRNNNEILETGKLVVE